MKSKDDYFPQRVTEEESLAANNDSYGFKSSDLFFLLQIYKSLTHTSRDKLVFLKHHLHVWKITKARLEDSSHIMSSLLSIGKIHRPYSKVQFSERHDCYVQ